MLTNAAATAIYALAAHPSMLANAAAAALFALAAHPSMLANAAAAALFAPAALPPMLANAAAAALFALAALPHMLTNAAAAALFAPGAHPSMLAVDALPPMVLLRVHKLERRQARRVVVIHDLAMQIWQHAHAIQIGRHAIVRRLRCGRVCGRVKQWGEGEGVGGGCMWMCTSPGVSEQACTVRQSEVLTPPKPTVESNPPSDTMHPRRSARGLTGGALSGPSNWAGFGARDEKSGSKLKAYWVD